MPAPLDRADEARGQLGRPPLDHRLERVERRGVDERVDGVLAEQELELGLELLAQPRLDVGAQLRERLELAGRSRELVVERRQAPSP